MGLKMKQKHISVNFPPECSKEIYSCTNVINPWNSYIHDESICENLNSYFSVVYKDENVNYVPSKFELPNFLEDIMDDFS